MSLPHALMEEKEVEVDETDPAFVDLDDPSNEILDESNLGEINDDDDGGSGEEEGDAETAAGGDEEAAALMMAEDLNEIPDFEPERDDALCVFRSHDGRAVHAVAVHPCDTRVFAASGESDEVYVLELAEDSRSVVLRAVLREPHSDTVSVLAFSPDGAWLASGGLDSVVAIWSTATWQLQHCLRDLSGEVLQLLWHPSSRVLVAGADDAQAAMWNVMKGTLAMYFVGHGGPVNCTVWSPDLKKLVAGGGDGSVIVFSPKTGEQEAHIAKGLSSDRASVTALCCIADGSGCDKNNTKDDDKDDRCVVGCEDGTMHVISLHGGRAVSSLQELHTQAIEGLRVSSGTNHMPRLLLSASCDCRIAVWNLADLSLRSVIGVGESVIPALWVQPHFIAAGCSDGEVKVWDGRSLQQQPLVRLMGHRRMVLDLAISPGANGVVASASDDGTVRFFALNLH